jgi:hypothetical protein
MFIFYDNTTGVISFTVNGESYPPSLLTDAIGVLEVPDGQVTDIHGRSVIDGNVVVTDTQPAKREFRDSINVKRFEIISAGVDVEITGYGTVALQGRPEDQMSLQGLAFGAQLRMSMGDSSTQMDFLDRNNTLHKLIPEQMIELWQKGAGFVSAVYARSWAIKEMDYATTDINDPSLWAI